MAKRGNKTKNNHKKQDKKKDKAPAILAYITWLGLIIAIIMNSNEKNKFVSFHIRQALMIMIVGTIATWIPVINSLLLLIVFILWIIGLIGAIEGKEKEVPLIGKLAQEWFKSI